MPFTRSMFLTLQPSNPCQKKQYWDFKIKWIRKLIMLWALLSIVVWIFTVCLYLIKLERRTFLFVICASLACVLWLMIIIASKYTDSFVYLMPPVRILITAFILMSASTEKPLSDGCDYKSFAPTLVDELYFSLAYLIDILLLSPTLKLTLFAHAPIYILSHIIHAQYVIEPGDKISI